MRSLTIICGALMALSVTAVGAADDLYALKDVTTVNYTLWNERVMPKDKKDKRCIVDYQTWRVNVEFTFNQTTQLKFVDGLAHSKESERLYGALDAAKFGTPAYDEASRKAEAWNFMPWFHIGIYTAVIPGGVCFAQVKTEVAAWVKSAQTWTSDYNVRNHTVEIWSTESWWSGPPGDLDKDAMGMADTQIKKFLNNLAEAKRTPWWGK